MLDLNPKHLLEVLPQFLPSFFLYMVWPINWGDFLELNRPKSTHLLSKARSRQRFPALMLNALYLSLTHN